MDIIVKYVVRQSDRFDALGLRRRICRPVKELGALVLAYHRMYSTKSFDFR